jgi:hypothetical protein
MHTVFTVFFTVLTIVLAAPTIARPALLRALLVLLRGRPLPDTLHIERIGVPRQP